MDSLALIAITLSMVCKSIVKSLYIILNCKTEMTFDLVGIKIMLTTFRLLGLTFDIVNGKVDLDRHKLLNIL